MSTSFSQEDYATRRQSGWQPISTKISLLLLAVSTAIAAEPTNIFVEVQESPHVVASLTMNDGHTFQVQGITFYTNKFVIENGETNLYKIIQGPTLSNWCDFRLVPNDRPPGTNLPPIPHPPILPIQPHTPK